VTPDNGLSAPFNSFFTIFGQFFDHGLDLISKDGVDNGFVFIPLATDDPLYYSKDPNVRTAQRISRVRETAMMFNHLGDDSGTFNLPADSSWFRLPSMTL
jgi:hypothetical protein